MLLGIVLLGAGLAGLAGAPAGVMFFVCLVVYFTGFNTLEASLPAMVSRVAPMRARGAALGVYSTLQYLGAFAGGIVGGWLLGAGGEHVALAALTGLCLAWVLIAVGLREPPRLSVEQLPIGPVERDAVETLTARLLAVPGVIEAVVEADQRIAWLRVDRRQLDRTSLHAPLVDRFLKRSNHAGDSARDPPPAGGRRAARPRAERLHADGRSPRAISPATP